MMGSDPLIRPDSRGQTPFGDEDARRLIHDAIDQTLVVEAAAGTGKTTELVRRIVRVLAEGRADVREIVAVTFTEKAAGELKLRLRQQLEEARRDAPQREVQERLDAAVQHLEEAHVSTIHGFCADVLRERPVEGFIDPLFRVLTEGQAEQLFNEAFSSWFQDVLAHPPEGVRRSLRRASRFGRPGDADEDGPAERLRRAGFELAEWRDFREPWTREPFDRAGAIARLIELVHEVAELSRKPSYAGDNLFADTEPVRRLSRDLRRMAKPASEEDLDELESLLVELRRNRDVRRARKGSGPTYAKGVTRARVLDARDRLIGALDDFQVRADADLAALLHTELMACVAMYERLKTREGALDFLDLLVRARDLVKDNAEVRSHFQDRFRRIFVDEFQDTDPLQAELLLLLAADNPAETDWRTVAPAAGKLFIVGDPKQSIYRFRRADVDVYRRVSDMLVARGATRVELRKSFRSVPNIQRLVNAAFEPLMDGNVDTHQARYVALQASREDNPLQPSVVVLPVPEPYGQRFIAGREIERSLPDAVGAYVDWLVRKSGWTVSERHAPERWVPLEARHICILFRRFVSYGQDVTRTYVEALEARGVKHLLVGGKAFHDRDEIETLRAALMAVEWPDDQLSVFATLRGALFAIGDEELLEYHRIAKRFHPFRVPESLPAGLEPIRDALTLLRALHGARNHRPVSDTITSLLDHTRAHVGFVLRPGGEQALANVLHVSELARQYELQGGMSFRGFVETLRQAGRGGEAAEAPILEEGSDGVRLMTVHKAKGLEFPVVVLADITARLTPWDASRYVDHERGLCALRIGGWSPKDLNDHRALEIAREQKEGERVAYVAATRARDLLVIPAVGDAPYPDGWVSPLNAAIYPAEGERRDQQRGPGCPAFHSKDSVLLRPGGDPASRSTVCPGAHRVGVGVSHTVVWWSPESQALSLKVQAPFGLRRDDLIVKDVPPEILLKGLDAHQSWKAGRDADRAAASRPSIDVITATKAAETLADRGSDPLTRRDSGGLTPIDEVPVTLVSIFNDAPRPGGARFGSLVHALLADAPLGEGPAILESLSDAHGRILGATREEIIAARTIVAAVLAHPLLQAAARAAREGQCFRETPVTCRLASGQLVEGYVDLAYRDGSSFVIVDFKTDRELDGSLERYRKQVSIYATAIGHTAGLPTQALLVRV
jgi:ATP-dependent exoDNAse (exonuclease V) beta subunit